MSQTTSNDVLNRITCGACTSMPTAPPARAMTSAAMPDVVPPANLPFSIKVAPAIRTTKMGATLHPDHVATFRVWAPNAASVSIKVRHDDSADTWAMLDLGKDPDSETWSADIQGVQHYDAYRFVITNIGGDVLNPGGMFERVDPYAMDVDSSNPLSPGYILRQPDDYTPFTTPPWEDFTIYQLHVGSFAGRNDSTMVRDNTARYDQIIAHLDYIKSMNFTAVEFLPTGEYPGDRSEGYAPTNFFAPESSMGLPDQLHRLVEACHQRGLAVIFDVIYNHVPAFDETLAQFDGNLCSNGKGIYYLDGNRMDWGYRLDMYRQQVQQFIVDNAAMWFGWYKVDGLRFDSVHNIWPATAVSDILWQLRQRYPSKLLIAEHDDPNWAVNFHQFSSAWQMGSADAFLKLLRGESMDNAQWLIGYDGVPYPFNRVKYLLGSHDQVYNAATIEGGQPVWEKADGQLRYFIERAGGWINGRDNWTARAQARMGWAMNVAVPGLPMLFMGTELHHYGYWTPSLDMYGDHRFDWSLAQTAEGKQMQALVQCCNCIRQQYEALRIGTVNVPHMDPNNRIVAFTRTGSDGKAILTVCNFGDQQFDLPNYGVVTSTPGQFQEIFNSQAPQFGGWADSGNGPAALDVQPNGMLYIRVPKWSTLMFRQV